MKKDVLLIGPTTRENINDTRWVTAPLGVHYLASWLNRCGYLAQVWDQNIDEDSFEKRVLSGQWAIIGFSVLEATKEYDLSRIHQAHKLSPESFLVAGGFGASLDYQLLFDHSPLNAVIQAEGEYPLKALCDMLISGQGYAFSPLHTIPGLILRNPAQPLSMQDYQKIRTKLGIMEMKADRYWKKTAALYSKPDWGEVNTFRLNTSNFCPMGCAFCTLTNLRKYAYGGGNLGKVLMLESSQIISLIMEVVAAYPQCRRIFFCDDDFLISRQRGMDFCREVIRSQEVGKIPRDMTFICLTNICRIDSENIKLLALAGFKVLSIGVESLSQRVLDSLDKKQDAGKVAEVTDLIIQYGIQPYYSLILFTPYGNMTDLMGDIVGFRQLGERGVGLSIEPYLIPLKGTRFAEQQIHQRIRRVEIEGTTDSFYKGFAWLPMDPEVRKVFTVFEEIYPKLRKPRIEEAAGTHTEKRFQAYVLLEAAGLAVFRASQGERYHGTWGTRESLKDTLSVLDTLPNLIMDTVGSVK